MPDLKVILDSWLRSCTRRGRISRNTVAVGIVILNRLREKCPLETSDILSDGGEISGSRAGLPNILKKYGIPAEKYLKEATTRQSHQDGQRLLDDLGYGKCLMDVGADERDNMLCDAIDVLCKEAIRWISRQNLKIACDRQQSPSAWVHSILQEAKGRSGGKVEQHLVGAKLEQRHPETQVPNFPSHAADTVTHRDGDFTVGSTCYHVTATPGLAVVRKAATNLGKGLLPVLLVPRDQVAKARNLAEEEGVHERIEVFAIEDFVGQNIIEMSKGQQAEFSATLKAIIEKYNRRLQEVETDLSLKIELQ